jgi:hypothetical protein
MVIDFSGKVLHYGKNYFLYKNVLVPGNIYIYTERERERVFVVLIMAVKKRGL